MAQVVCCRIEEELQAQLEKRALTHGWSLEEEVRQILSQALTGQGQSKVGLGTRIASRFAGTGLDGEIPELREYAAESMDFDN